jgi:tRNA nucleotidyltransferase (CCA-adding enzyme)
VARLSPDLRRAAASARAVSRQTRTRAFLAGGVVRDLLLGRPVRDLDIVIEGDGPAFARRLAARLGASVRVHERFGTATLTLPSGAKLDVASARRERYASPGALPAVEAGASIEEDLARRDFTINALALALATGPGLVDPWGGRADLSRGIVRVLHPRSFFDDPTRAFRAVRYSNRLGFHLAAATRVALRSAISAGAFEFVSGDRLRREIRLIFDEPGRARALHHLETLGLTAALDRALARRSGAGGRLRRAERLAGRPGVGWLCYFLAWVGAAEFAEVEGIARRLTFAGGEWRTLLGWPHVLGSLARATSPGADRAEMRRAVRGRSEDELVAAAASLPLSQGRRLAEAMQSRAPGLTIRGRDLAAAGIPPGPAIGRALERTRNALEDGLIERSEELDFALRAAREESR